MIIMNHVSANLVVLPDIGFLVVFTMHHALGVMAHFSYAAMHNFVPKLPFRGACSDFVVAKVF